MSLLLALLLLAPQEDARSLIEKIRSGSVQEREEASHKLKEMGKAAAAELEKAAQDSNAEVSGIAKKLLALLKLRDTLPAGLMKAVRGIEDRLAFGSDTEWTRVFLETEAMNQEGRRVPLVKRRDLEPLAERALTGAETAELKSEVLDALVRRRLPAAGVVALLEDDELNTQAFESLAQHPTEQGVAKLRELTRHKMEELRVFAIESLAELDAREASADMEKLIKDPSAWVRSRATSAWARLRGKEAAAGLVSLLKDKDGDVREAAVNGLLAIYAKEEGKRIAELLRDPEPQVRRYSAGAVGTLGYRDAVPSLLGLLKEEGAVRAAALGALKLLRAKEAVPEALKLLEGEITGEVHILLEFLSQTAPKESGERAVELLKHAKPEARSMAIALLEEVGDKSAAPDLLRLLKEGEEEERMRAAWALGWLGIKEAIPELMHIVKAGAYSHRHEPLTALAQLEAKEAIPILIPCLKTDGVQQDAMEALGVLKAKEGVAEIAGFLKSRDQGDRMHAIRALVKIEGREAIPRILPYLDDPETQVVTEAIHRLGQIEAWDQAAKVAPYLEDRVSEVRAEAAGFLARAGSREGVSVLLEEREDGELWLLNELRTPESWKRLQKIKVSGRRRGTALERVRILAKEADLEVEVEPSPLGDGERWLEREVSSSETSEAPSLLEAIWWDLPTAYEFILEGNRLRLVPLESARRFWTAWWKEGGATVK